MYGARRGPGVNINPVARRGYVGGVLQAGQGTLSKARQLMVTAQRRLAMKPKKRQKGKKEAMQQLDQKIHRQLASTKPLEALEGSAQGKGTNRGYSRSR